MDLKKKAENYILFRCSAIISFKGNYIKFAFQCNYFILQTSFFHCNFALNPPFSKVTYTPDPYSAYTLCFPSFRCPLFSKTSLDSIPLDNEKAAFCKKQSYCVSHFSMFALGVDNQF